MDHPLQRGRHGSGPPPRRLGRGPLWIGLPAAAFLLALPRAGFANTCTLAACPAGCGFAAADSWTGCGDTVPGAGDVVVVPEGAILDYDTTGATTGPWIVRGTAAFDPGPDGRDASGMRTLVIESPATGQAIDLAPSGRLVLRERDRLLFSTEAGPAIVRVSDGALLDAQGTVTPTSVASIVAAPADLETCGTTTGRKWTLTVPDTVAPRARRQGRVVFMSGRASPRHYEIVSDDGASPIVVCTDLADEVSANFECVSNQTPYACCSGPRSGACSLGQRLTKHRPTGAPPVPAHSVPELTDSADTRLDPAAGDQIALVSDAWIAQISGTNGYRLAGDKTHGNGVLPVFRAVNLASPGEAGAAFAAFNVNAREVTASDIEFDNVHDYLFDDGFVYGGAHDYLIQWNAGHDSASTASDSGAIFLPRNTVTGQYGVVTSPIDNVSVLHNHLYATNGNAIQVNVGIGTSTGNKVDFNLVHDGCTTLEGECNGIEVGSCAECEVAHNVVYNLCSLSGPGYSGIDSNADIHHNWVVNVCGNGIFPASDYGDDAQSVTVAANYVSHVIGNGIVGGGRIVGNVVKNWGLNGYGNGAGIYQGIGVYANYLGIDDAVAASPTCDQLSGDGCGWTGILEDRTIGNWNGTAVDIQDNIVSGRLGSNRTRSSCLRLQPSMNFSATIAHLTCDGRGGHVIGVDNAIHYDPGSTVSIVSLDIAHLYANGAAILVCPTTRNVLDVYGNLYSLQSSSATDQGGTVSGMCDTAGSLMRPVDDMGYRSRTAVDYNFVQGAAGLSAGGWPPGSPIGARVFHFDRDAVRAPWAGIVGFDGDFPAEVANVSNADTDGDGVIDRFDNCPRSYDPGLHDADGDGVGDLCDNCVSSYNPAPAGSAAQLDSDGDGPGDACDPCPFDPFDDEDQDGVCGDSDNCPRIANADQADVDGNGLGDVCEGLCDVTVDASGSGGFASIQQAIDHVVSLGLRTCRVEVGDGTYPERLTLPAPVTIAAAGPGVPVVDGGRDGAVVTVPFSFGGAVSLRGLALRGGVTGISADRSIDLTDVSVTQVAAGGIGLDVQGGTTTLHGTEIEVGADPASVGLRVGAGSRRPVNPAAVVAGADPDAPGRTLSIRAPGGTGIEVAAGASAAGEAVEIRGAGTGLRVGGAVGLASSLIADGATGILIEPAPGAELSASFMTVSGNGIGVEDLNGGARSMSLSRSIVWGNGADLADPASCSRISASDVGTADCTAGGNPDSNLRVDPAFVDALDADPGKRDYRLRADSPLLDPLSAAVGPKGFRGAPCHDLSGAPRLLDADGDGLAVSDLGAYESQRARRGPLEVEGFGFEDPATLVWDAQSTAAVYTILRGAGAPGGGPLGYCLSLSPLQTNDASTTLSDAEDPPLGSFFYYVVLAVDALGHSGTLGEGTCAERTPIDLCGPP